MRTDDIFEDLNIDDEGPGGKKPSGAGNSRKGTGGRGEGLAPGDLPGSLDEYPDDDDDFFNNLEDIEGLGLDRKDSLSWSAPGSTGRKTDGSWASRGRKLKELNSADSSIDRRRVKKNNEDRKKKRIKKAIIWTLVELITLALIFAYGYGLRTWNLIQRDEIDVSAVENTNISVEKREQMERGYWTFAVFGVDSRSDSVVAKGLNSDVIIIASINKETGDIKLVSVFRDTYLNISDSNSYNKINAAYSQGGPEQAIAALNKNLDLNITEYVAFNWKAVAQGINFLGGIDGISISKAELYYINAYITETVKVTGIGSYQLTSTGEQHLDGVQAVAYGRLRYMDTDFARTERQRKVIMAAFEKAKTADFAVLNQIMVVCFPQVASNINFNTLVSMAQNISRYNIAETGGFPWSRGDAVMGSKGDCVIPTTLESNVKLLHEFLFGDEDYTPSDAVLRISEKIKSDTGLYSEGTVIESVSTDGGVIQNKSSSGTTSTKKADGDDDEDDDDDITIGVDDDGSYIYPTDEDGNFVIPTDEDGNVVYPTDEDGNVVKNTSSLRPTDLSDEADAPGEGEADADNSTGRRGASSPGGSTTQTTVSPTSAPTTAATETTAVESESAGEAITSNGPLALGTTASTEESTAASPGQATGPGSASTTTTTSTTTTPSSTVSSSSTTTTDSSTSIISSSGPGSISTTSSDSAVISAGPGG